jgi:hypothetical protein
MFVTQTFVFSWDRTRGPRRRMQVSVPLRQTGRLLFLCNLASTNFVFHLQPFVVPTAGAQPFPIDAQAHWGTAHHVGPVRVRGC